jgi:hypothetical protein
MLSKAGFGLAVLRRNEDTPGEGTQLPARQKYLHWHSTDKLHEEASICQKSPLKSGLLQSIVLTSEW